MRDCGNKAGVTITTDIDEHLPRAHVMVTATNAVRPFISARHLRQGAMVCDVSRPSTLRPISATTGPTCGGGRRTGACAGGSVLELLEEPERRNVLLACAAETIILALSGYRSEHLCGRLDPATIEEMGKLAARLGFSAAS